MDGFVMCQACMGPVAAHLLVAEGTRRNPSGCCVRCQSFACRFHGERESSSQQFRCVECLPASLLYSAVACSGSENELAKAIIARQRGSGQNAFDLSGPKSFLEEHELVREQTGELLSGFYQRSEFDLNRPELDQPGWEKMVRDLRRIQFRLESTRQRDLLKLAAAYIAFLYPPEGQAALPQEMQVLRSSLVSSGAGALEQVDGLLVT
jgi:hypothetical protein